MTTMTILNIPDWAQDRPSQFDYTASDLEWLLWAVEQILPFPQDLLKIFNQWADADTYYSCTRQWLANITNGNNLIFQASQDILLAKNEWIKAYNANPWIKNAGDYLQNALKQFVDDKLIAGYYIVKGKQEHMDAIDKGHWIYSWSTNGDWNSVATDGVYKIKTPSSGHAWVKWIAYDDTWLTGINSYGQENGYFTIPWDLCDTTFTSYWILDFVDESAILAYKQKLNMEQVQKMVDLGITNGKDLEKPILRREAIVMIARLYELLKK